MPEKIPLIRAKPASEFCPVFISNKLFGFSTTPKSCLSGIRNNNSYGNNADCNKIIKFSLFSVSGIAEIIIVSYILRVNKLAHSAGA